MKTTILLICSIFMLLFSPSVSLAKQNSGVLKGFVRDIETNEVLPFANVVIRDREGNIITGVATDIKGSYSIPDVVACKYKVEVSFTGYKTEVYSDIEIEAYRHTLLNAYISKERFLLTECTIYFEPVLISTRTTCCYGRGCSHSFSNCTESRISALKSIVKPKEDSILSFHLYPNPSSGDINLEFENKIDKVIVSNINGQVVTEFNIANSNQLSTNLQHLPPATYVVQVISGQKRISKLWVLHH